MPGERMPIYSTRGPADHRRVDSKRVVVVMTATALGAQLVVGAAANAVQPPAQSQRTDSIVTHTNRDARPVKPKIKIEGGIDLTIKISAGKGKGNSKGKYTFALSRIAGKKLAKLGNFKTAAKTGQSVLDLPSGKYRITVKAGRHTLAAAKTFTYTEVKTSAADAPARSGYYAMDYDWVYYFPAGYQPTGRTYPAIITYSPGQVDSVPGPYDAQLKNIADRYGFIVLSSRLYRNPPAAAEARVEPRYPDQFELAFNWWPNATKYCSRETLPSYAIGGIYDLARAQIQNVLNALPIDQSRVVLMGLSGGASFAHAINLWYPKLASAMVINTGMIWGTALPEGEMANGPTWNQFLDYCRRPSDYAGAKREAWFLESSAGPSGPDFRYDEMKADEIRYRDTMGWDVHAIDFYGGHTMAPVSVYDTVFDQLTSSMGWR